MAQTVLVPCGSSSGHSPRSFGGAQGRVAAPLREPPPRRKLPALDSKNKSEFNEFFKSDYSSDRFDTISGLLINNFKGLPKTHDEISFDNFKFQIKIYL